MQISMSKSKVGEIMKLLIYIVAIFSLMPVVYAGNLIVTGGMEVEIESGSMQGLSKASPNDMTTQLAIDAPTLIKNLNDLTKFSDGLGNTATSKIHIRKAYVPDKDFYALSSGIEDNGVFAELVQTGDITGADSIEVSATANNQLLGLEAFVGLNAKGNAALSNYHNKAYAGPDSTYAFQNLNYPEWSTGMFQASGDILQWYVGYKTSERNWETVVTPYGSPASTIAGVYVEPGGVMAFSTGDSDGSGLMEFTWQEKGKPKFRVSDIWPDSWM